MSTCSQIAQRAEYFRERLSGNVLTSTTFLNRGGSNDKEKLKKNPKTDHPWYKGDRFDPDYRKKKELWEKYLEEQKGASTKPVDTTGKTKNSDEIPKTFHSVLGPESHFQ
jgi:hypothetical protein